jgi:CRP-like cAMP-binding protein
MKREQSSAVTTDEVGMIEAFAGLASDALEECAALAVRRELRTGRLIFTQGEPCTRFQALISGRVRISQAGRDGGQVLLRFIGPGELFGWFGMFAERAYPAEAVVVAPSLEVSWSDLQIHQLMERYPPIATNLLAVAARRLAVLQERLREVTTQPAEQRIANALLRLVRGIHPAEDGPVVLAWPLTRKDMAALSATTLYTASRVMARWERNGIIHSQGRRLTVNTIGELVRIADGS